MKKATPSEHTTHTLDYLARTLLSKRKGLGQYFTPEAIRRAVVEKLPQRSFKKILDPGVGTGEFLVSAGSKFPAAELHGWDIDPEVIATAKKNIPSARLSVRDFLNSQNEDRFDLIIGNPPYYEFKPEAGLRERYAAVISGRPNIFALFFQEALSRLEDGGVLAFVVPTSMNNGAYFSALRDYIMSNAEIHSLDVVNGDDRFVDAQQAVMGIILVKKSSPTINRRHVFERAGLRIFTQDSGKLEVLYRGRKTLSEMGFRVATGRVVWNQRKGDLTHSPDGATPLLWAHNIGQDGELVFPVSCDKPQYVRGVVHDIGPAIIVNRITGAGPKALLRAALVPAGMRFIGENHVNVITAKGRASEEAFRFLVRQLRGGDIREFARQLTGNTQISKTELETLIPFDEIVSPARQPALA